MYMKKNIKSNNMKRSDLIPDLTEEFERPTPQQKPNPAKPNPQPTHERKQINS